ncbi:MAG: NAD-dependent epimerase/dehydratase family protein [Gemmatimonadales bacterium]
MNVRVTGANGFVGRCLVQRLHDCGHDVRGGCGAEGPAASPGSGRGEGRGHLEWVRLDVTDRTSVTAFLEGPCDAVIHLAGIASVRAANAKPAAAWAVNAGGTALVAEALAGARGRAGSDPLLLVASSAEVYSRGADRPYRETDPVGPTTAYAASKLGAELAALQTWRCTGLRVVVARPFPHIGPGQSAEFWVARRARVLLEAKRLGAPAVTVGDLTPVRDFLHVEDVVDAYIGLLTKGRPGETYNVASGQGVTLETVHAKLEALIGVHPVRERDAGEVRPDARPHLVGDAAKLRAATGWAPRRSLDDTLREVVDAQAD